MTTKRDELFEAYCADALDPAGRERLAALLADDAAAREAFAVHLLEHAALRDAATQIEAFDPCGSARHPRRQAGTRSRATGRVARRSRRRRRPVALALPVGAALVLAALVALLVVIDREPTAAPPGAGPVLASVSGAVAWQRPGHPATGRHLRPGDQLRTGPAAAVTLRFADGTELRLADDGELRWEGATTGKRVALLRGELAATVAPQPPDAPLVVAGPTATATVLGTELRCRAGPGWSELTVTSGRVRFDRPGVPALEVAAGERALAAPGVPWAVLSLDAAPVITLDPATASLEAGSDWRQVEDATAFSGRALEGRPEGELSTLVARAHAGDAPGALLPCFAEAERVYELRLHLATVPTGEKPFRQDMVWIDAPGASWSATTPWRPHGQWSWLPPDLPRPLPLFNGIGSRHDHGTWSWTTGPADAGQEAAIPDRLRLRFARTGVHQLRLVPMEGPLRIDRIELHSVNDDAR